MKKISKIDILGMPFGVTWVKVPSMDASLEHGKLAGRMFLYTRQIHVDATMTEEQQERVFYHELVHAILGASGVSNVLDDSQEEAVCDALGNALPSTVKVK